MRSELREVFLGDVCEIKQGKYLSPKNMEPNPTTESAVPVIGGNGVLGYTSKSTFDFDVPLVTCRGSRCGLMQWGKNPSWISNNAMAVFFREGQGDNRFLFHLLNHLDFDSVVTGSAQPQITVTNLSMAKIQIPDIESQSAIAEILSRFDQKIFLNSQIASTLEQIAQTIFKSWFIDFDPVHAKTTGEQPVGMDAETAALFPDSFEDSELGPIPSGWRVNCLKDFIFNVKDSIKAGSETLELPYVPVDKIDPKNIFLTQTAPSESAKTSLIKFKKGDLLFGAMRPYFHKVCVSPFEGVTRTTTFVLRPLEYKYYSLFSLFLDSTVAFASAHSQGSTIPYAVWENGLADMKIISPDKHILSKFEGIIEPLINFGESILHQNVTLTEIRDSLLPRLISGELQIPDEMLAS